MNNDKYVFFDIDGTIYDYDHGVIPSVKDAVKKLHDNGHHPVICTGRTKVMIFDEIMELGFDGIIAGAGTYVEWDGKPLYNIELPHEQVVRIIDIMRRHGFCSYPEGHESFYYDEEYVKNGFDDIYNIYQKKIPEHIFPIDLSKNMHVAKVSAMYTPESDRDGALEELGDDFYWADHSGVLFETIIKKGSKGMGVRRLIEHVGGSLDNTYAFGDSFNDLDMLRTVRYGYCMGNAKESLKEAVKLHTEPMLEDGVFNALVREGLITR